LLDLTIATGQGPNFAMIKNRLAVWMIVRDDVYYVDMAIKSVLPFVDGIYILDNGSSDRTIEKIEAKDYRITILTEERSDLICS